jgi:hypothetical protein
MMTPLSTVDANSHALARPVAVTIEDGSTLLAQGKNNRRGSRGRKKILTGEKRSAKGSTEIDFDATSIDGQRKTPVGVSVGGSKSNNGFDLIKLRLHWHPEMVQSTSNLETGKGP